MLHACVNGPKPCRGPVVSLSHASKSYRVNRHLAKKTKVAASPKILPLELLREMFSAKYGVNW